MTTLYQIDTGYACFGIVVTDGKVTDAPPIAKWAIGEQVDFVLDYYRECKNATVTVVQESGKSKTA